MRLVIAAGDPDQVLPGLSRLEAKAIVDALTRDVITAMDLAEYELVKRRLKALASADQAAMQVLDAIRAVPLTDRASSPPVDARLSDFASAHHSEWSGALSDPRLLRLLAERQRGTSKGESRESVYTRVFKPLASTAVGVSVFDPFIPAQLVEQRDGVKWMLGRLAQDGIEFVNLLTVGGRGVTDSDVEIALRRLGAQVAPATRLILTIARVAGPHDRHFRFHYRDQTRITPTVDVGKGFDTFNTINLRSAYKVESASWSSAVEREQEIRKAKFKRTITVPPA